MLILNVNWGNAFIITFVGLFIVFMLLVFLVGVVSSFGLIANKVSTVANTNAKTLDKEKKDEVTNGDYVAIAMALHLYMDLHDQESDIITIKDTDRRYSPWSSKIYGLKYLG
jgi:glutaconyl-CoA/methylmalonyl-CoA decarboxylase subunit delta